MSLKDEANRLRCAVERLHDDVQELIERTYALNEWRLRSDLLGVAAALNSADAYLYDACDRG